MVLDSVSCFVANSKFVRVSVTVFIDSAKDFISSVTIPPTPVVFTDFFLPEVVTCSGSTASAVVCNGATAVGSNGKAVLAVSIDCNFVVRAFIVVVSTSSEVAVSSVVRNADSTALITDIISSVVNAPVVDWVDFVVSTIAENTAFLIAVLTSKESVPSGICSCAVNTDWETASVILLENTSGETAVVDASVGCVFLTAGATPAFCKLVSNCSLYVLILLIPAPLALILSVV